jgi:hypothetical protein
MAVFLYTGSRCVVPGCFSDVEFVARLSHLHPAFWAAREVTCR